MQKQLGYTDRVYNHINKTGGKVFIPLDRMRHIRWEEAVNRAILKREGYVSDNGSKIEFEHWHCSCGSIECLGNPRALGAYRPRRPRKQ